MAVSRVGGGGVRRGVAAAAVPQSAAGMHRHRHDGVQLRSAAAAARVRNQGAGGGRSGRRKALRVCSSCVAASRGQGHDNKRHDNVRRAAISGQKCARPGDQVMKHATCRGASRGEGSHQAGEPLLNPVWEGEAAACSAAGRGREGVETAFATASCRRSRRELRKPA